MKSLLGREFWAVEGVHITTGDLRLLVCDTHDNAALAAANNFNVTLAEAMKMPVRFRAVVEGEE